MKRGMRNTMRMFLTCLALLAGLIPPATPADTSQTGDAMVAPHNDAVASREVRLRKLHLVRPDLIPYPIHYDVYC